MNYELVLDFKDYKHPEKRFLIILPDSLEEIDSFTSEFTSELEFKYYLLKRKLIHESNLNGEVRIRKEKENKVLPGKAIYKNDAELLNVHNLAYFYMSNSNNYKLMSDLYYAFKSSVGTKGLLYSLHLPIRDLVNYKENYGYYQETNISDAVEDFVKELCSRGYTNIHKLAVIASKYRENTMEEIIPYYVDNQTRLNFIREQIHNLDLLPDELAILEEEEFEILKEMEACNEKSSRH